MPPKPLEIPTLPPPSSKFILPPSTNSDLMDRLKAFLPLMKESNDKLVQAELGAEEGVSLEEFSEEEEDSEVEQPESEHEEEIVEEQKVKGMAGLLDIGNKPNLTKLPPKTKIIEIKS